MDQARIFNYAISKNKLKLISRSDHQITLIVLWSLYSRILHLRFASLLFLALDVMFDALLCICQARPMGNKFRE